MIKNQINRTPEMIARYRAERDNSDTIDDLQTIHREFTYWRIIENKFPYDAVFKTHHLLLSKRHFSNLSAATPAELDEIQTIKAMLAEEQAYDGILENLSSNISKPGHCHLHLFIWKYYDETTEVGNDTVV